MNSTDSSKAKLPFSAKIWLTLAFIAFNVLTIIGNVLVIGIVLVNHRLRSCANYLVVNLSIADMLFACTSYPFVIGSIIHQTTVTNNALCIFIGFSDSFYTTSSSFSVAIIAYERYYSIIHCLHYEQSLVNRKTKLVISGVWISSLLISLAPLLNWGTYRFERAQYKCTLAFQYDKGYFFFRFLVVFLLPLSVMSVCYNWIFTVARRHANSITNIEIRVQNDLAHPVQRNNCNTKHTGSVFIAIVVYIICCLPINILYVVKNLKPNVTIPEQVLATGSFLSLFSCSINPIVYALVTGKFRKGFFRLCNKLRPRENRVVPKRTSPGTWTLSSVRFSRRGSTSHAKIVHKSENISKGIEIEGNTVAKQSGVLLQVQTLEASRLSSLIENKDNPSLLASNKSSETTANSLEIPKK